MYKIYSILISMHIITFGTSRLQNPKKRFGLANLRREAIVRLHAGTLPLSNAPSTRRGRHEFYGVCDAVYADNFQIGMDGVEGLEQTRHWVDRKPHRALDASLQIGPISRQR